MPKRTLLYTLFCLLPLFSFCQSDTHEDSLSYEHSINIAPETSDPNSERLTLEECLEFAAKHQPALKQSYIDEAIARTNNAINVSGWLPQVNAFGDMTHYYQLPTAFIPNSQTGEKKAAHTGVYNTSTPTLNATQVIFSPAVLLATRTARLNNQQAKENTANIKITLVSEVTKSFYDLLLTQQQITVLKEDTARLNKNKSDAYHQYVSGIVDKVDYKQASISLNNSMAQLRNAQESLQAKYATLKQLMGYPPRKEFVVNYDTAEMMQDTYFDTTQALEYQRRIEYQQLQTLRRIEHETTAYYQLGFIPSVGAFYNYYQPYLNDNFSKLYNQAYPYSTIGLNFSVPLFTGFRRLENVHKARLQEKRDDWEVSSLKSEMYTEYKQALASYKSNLYNLHAMEDNVQMAKEVYNIVRLQYREGIKAYLDVITAEADLRTSEINYLNALFQLLSSKVDLQKALGDITPTF
ncbi:MAG: TolC family protein [Taibaiella sp.]|nr:TolC family protein [Taibaiella sp.]